MDMLDRAREERLTAKNATLKLPVAALTSVEGEGDLKTLIYKLPHDGFQWTPGDTVSAWPCNSNEKVSSVLNALAATGDELVELSEEWRLHLKQFINLGMKTGNRSTCTQLRYLIQFSQLDPVPNDTVSYLSTILPALVISRSYKSNCNCLDLPMLLGIIQMLFGDVFAIGEDGTMQGLKLDEASTLYYQLVKNGVEPLAEDIVKILYAIGAQDIPLLTDHSVDLVTFESKVFPIFVERLKRNLGARSVATAVDIFRPIKSRTYSIANCRDGVNLKLMVNRLYYKKEQVKSKSETIDDWRSQYRQVRLAHKCEELDIISTRTVNVHA